MTTKNLNMRRSKIGSTSRRRAPTTKSPIDKLLSSKNGGTIKATSGTSKTTVKYQPAKKAARNGTAYEQKAAIKIRKALARRERQMAETGLSARELQKTYGPTKIGTYNMRAQRYARQQAKLEQTKASGALAKLEPKLASAERMTKMKTNAQQAKYYAIGGAAASAAAPLTAAINTAGTRAEADKQQAIAQQQAELTIQQQMINAMYGPSTPTDNVAGLEKGVK